MTAPYILPLRLLKLINGLIIDGLCWSCHGGWPVLAACFSAHFNFATLLLSIRLVPCNSLDLKHFPAPTAVRSAMVTKCMLILTQFQAHKQQQLIEHTAENTPCVSLGQYPPPITVQITLNLALTWFPEHNLTNGKDHVGYLYSLPKVRLALWWDHLGLRRLL